MVKQKTRAHQKSSAAGITHITVAGFKSIHQEQGIEIRPLTILAGANSSGKSSIMQPLLLLKQTLEATYDPGTLLLNGPNIRFTSADQLLSRMHNGKAVDVFHVGFEVGNKTLLTTYFTRNKSRGKGFDIEQTVYGSGKKKGRLYAGMKQEEMLTVLMTIFGADWKPKIRHSLKDLFSNGGLDITLMRNRCFLTLVAHPIDFQLETKSQEEQTIRQIIHLPGLRGNPARTYPVTAVGSTFPGTFEKYVASIIEQWQEDHRIDKLANVNRDLARLGLTGGVIAEPIDDTQVELLVTRFGSNVDGHMDMVSIADVGIGVSQTLPVIVALHVADQEQLLYLEQPEVHLHPRAQSAMAEVLADAALQGARLVVETHSSLFLMGIQTLVAEGKLPPELVKLHWFKLLEDGSTRIISADLDEAGAFGDWPEDFAEVTLATENRYLDAAQTKLEGM